MKLIAKQKIDARSLYSKQSKKKEKKEGLPGLHFAYQKMPYSIGLAKSAESNP